MPFRGMFQRHAIPLSFYPPIPYSQASNHSVTVGFVKTMLFISTTFYVTRWRILSRVGGTVYARTGGEVGTTSFPFDKLDYYIKKVPIWGDDVCGVI